MKIVFFALFLLAAGLVFAGLNLLICQLAYPRDRRYLHCRIIPAVLLVLLAVTNVYTVAYPLQLLDKIINAPFLAYFFNLILPNRSYELVYMLLLLLLLNLFVTVLVITAVIVIKLAFLRSTDYIDVSDETLLHRLLRFPWYITGRFYEEINDTIRLNSKGFVLGIWVKGFKRAFVIVWALEVLVIAASILWGSKDWNTILLTVTKSWYMLPMAGFLLLEQIQFWLEGISEDEAGTFGSAEIQETQQGSMSALWDAYQRVFSRSGALLFSDMGGNHVPDQDGLGSNDLGNQQMADCSQPEVLHVITNQLQQCGTRQSEQYQNALVELLNNHSINICDQCEGEFLIFLCAYLNFHMSQGRTALMLCKDRKRAAQMCDAVNREMHRLNNLYSIWDVQTLEGAEINGRMSMLVCSVDDFLDHRIDEKRQDFVGDLFCVILADGIELFFGNALCQERLFGVLRSIKGLDQYIVFTDVNNDSLRTTMERAIKKEVLPFCNDAVHHPYAGTMIWREEHSCRLQQHIGIGDSMSPYMGTALPLALTAVKFDFPRVYLITDEAHPDRSYHDVLHMSSKETANFISKNVNLNSVIRYNLDEALKMQELSVTVIHDTDCNFFNTLTLWRKYSGTKGSLLHIICPPYALREYFVANFRSKRLYMKNNEFDALIPNHLGTKISHMAVLLVQLWDKGMTEAELMDKAKEYRWDYDNVDQLLTDCLKVVLTREEIHSIYECFHFEEEKIFREDKGEFETHTRITLIDSTISRRLQDLVGYAVLVSKNDQRQPLPILGGNVFNHCLRGQIIPVGGYLYKIRSICGGTIYGDQILPREVPNYHQICEFTFEDYHQTDSCVDTGFIDLNICTANVTRTVLGYWSSNCGNRFVGNYNVQVNHMNEPVQIRTACANILELRVRADEFGDQAPEAMRLLAYLLKDFARTLFPMTHQNLFAVVSDGTDTELLPRVLAAGKAAPLNDIVCSLIPRVKNPPAGQDDACSTIYVVESSCIEFGMVQMLYSRYKDILLMIREYLSWYLESNAAPAASDDEEAPAAVNGGAVRGTYLHFGADTVPSVLAPEALLKFCRKILAEESAPTDPIDVSADTNVPVCTFCGRPSMFPVELSDGRLMCGHCKDHQLTQKDEIKSMFAQTVQYLTEGYSITLPKNLHVRFQSADAIVRATGGTPNGRILGFYNSGNHQLWLEARGPKIAMQSTLIHELTHAWQHHDRDFSQKLQQVLRKYPRKERNRIRLLLMEGHAVYMEIETMRKMHEEAFADRMHNISMLRSDEYGVGYRMLRSYIVSQGELGSYMTPFKAMIQLLQDIIDGKVTIT